MRTFEAILLLALLACLLLPPRPRRWAALAAVLVALLHLGVEGERWQMVPAYILTALFAVLTLLQLRPKSPAALPSSAQPESRRRSSVVGRPVVRASLSVLVIILLALPPLLFPVPRLPDPGGPYAVGTRTFQWVDPERLEAYTPDPTDHRVIMVQVWYPAAPAAEARTAPWMESLDVAGPAMAAFLRLPSFFLDHAELMRTHAYPDAPAAPGGPFPVVLYSHGWNGFRTINLDQSEALASHGYIAVAVDHTYGAMVTVFADGGVALNIPDLLPDRDAGPAFQAASEALEATFATDLRFVLDELAHVDAGLDPGPLTGQLDLDRIGLYGHSTGGGAAVIACAQDPRCDAVLGQDAWLEPVPRPVIAAGLPQPALFLRSEVWASGLNDELLAQLIAASPAALGRPTILGTRHYDFTLLPLLSPLAPFLGLKGPLAGPRVLEINTDYLIAFFDQSLKDQPSPLLAGPSADYPEVVWE